MIWALIEALAETDRWAVRVDPRTGELYVEDVETLKRYGARIKDTSK